MQHPHFNQNLPLAPTSSIRSLQDLEFQRHYEGQEVDDFFERQYSAPTSLEELVPLRIPVAWRLVRELARQRGALDQPGMSLEELSAMGADYFRTPFHAVTNCPDKQLNKMCARNSTALFPMEVDQDFRSADGEIDEGYAIENDIPIQSYCEQLSRVAKILRIENTVEGRQGLTGLRSPVLVRQAMPHPQQLIEFESVIVRETIEAINTDGVLAAEKFLRTRFGLNIVEVRDVIAMARRLAEELVNLHNPAQFMAMQILLMERNVAFLERSAQHRAAFMARRDLTRLVLLHQSSGGAEQGVEDDMKVVEATVVDSKRARLIPQKPEDS